MMRFQMDMEDYYENIAKQQEKDVIILSDRGVLDPTAYCSEENKQKIFLNPDMHKVDLQERYDLVLHLVTAADGAEKFYTLENNEARSETPEVARMLDDLLKVAWNGAPNHTLVFHLDFSLLSESSTTQGKVSTLRSNRPTTPSLE